MHARVALSLAVLALAGVAGGCADDAGSGDSQDERPPVVVLILDEFPADDILGPDGQIDAARFPNFADLARHSTWFSNAFTVYDSTFKAVPAILDARLPKRLTSPDIRSHHSSIYTLFGRLGYDVVDVEAATAICPRSVCERARTRRPGVLARLAGSDRPSRLHHWIQAIGERRRPTLFIQHALLPHEPWIYLPSGRQSRPPGNDPIPGINKPWSFHDPNLSLHNHQRHLLQVGYVDRQIGHLLRRLRETGLFERALVAVVADHGYAFEVGRNVKERRQVTQTNVHQIGPVPFFLKLPGQTEGELNESFVRNMDLVPTIADVLGTRVHWKHDGISAFARASRARKRVSIVRRDFAYTVSISARELLQRRVAARRHWAKVFGTGAQSAVLYGSPWAAAYRIGPNQQLLGQPVSNQARAAARPGVYAGLANAELLRDVRLDGSEVFPTRVVGRIVGGRPGRLRDLAVAVNGRIRAVGRSFRLQGRPRESYSFVVPEGALRPGRNEIELFEVRPDGRLVQLYGTR